MHLQVFAWSHRLGIASHHDSVPVCGAARTTRDQAASEAVWVECGSRSLKEIEKQRAKEREKGRRKDDDKRTQVPEGDGVAFLVLGAGVLGGGVVVWRRKLRASA